MYNSETLKFAGRHILPLTLAIAIIFLVTTLVFPTFRLTFREFTLIYWSFIIVSSILNYQAMRWTKYIVKHYGLQMEKNPIMRKMLAKGDLKRYWIRWLGMCLLLFFIYIIGINAQVFFPFLIFPSWILAIFLYDFLNDFYWLRKLKTIKNNNKLQKLLLFILLRQNLNILRPQFLTIFRTKE